MPSAPFQLTEVPHKCSRAATARMRVRSEASDSDNTPQQAEPQRPAVSDIAPYLDTPDNTWMWIITLCTVAILICYADRTNISFAIVSMASEFQWTESYKGTILSVFFIGYAATQLVGGALADRIGGKSVLAAGAAAFTATGTPSLVFQLLLARSLPLCRRYRMVNLYIPDP